MLGFVQIPHQSPLSYQERPDGKFKFSHILHRVLETVAVIKPLLALKGC